MSYASLLRTPVKTPMILIEKEGVRKQLEHLSLFKGTVWFPVKTQPAPALLKFLQNEGCKFHVCSQEELRHVLGSGVNAGDVLYYNPSAVETELRQIAKAGVTKFTADSFEQAHQIAQLNPELVFIRMHLGLRPKDNTYCGSAGLGVVDPLPTLKLLETPRKGIHVHISSQNDDLRVWKRASDLLLKVLKQAERRKLGITDLNVGGGYPTAYGKAVPKLSAIRAALRPVLDYCRTHNIALSLEPGRYVVAPSLLLTSVKRVKDHTVFLDTSVYSTSMDTLIANMQLPVVSKARGRRTYTLRGNSTCALDTFGTVSALPLLLEGDRLGFVHAAAYNFHSDFMNLPKPGVKLV